MKLGVSGALTRAFIASPLTPLLLLAALLVGLIALQALPREEEPQISVPMVDILVSTNGYKAEDAIELVTRPLEDIIKGINGVEHVYSQTQDDNVVVTARFFVGTQQDNAVLRVHDKIRANITGLPKGIREPLIIGRGIDDVAIVVLTLAAKPERAALWTDNGLYQVAEELQHELTKVDNVGGSYIVGGAPNQIRVEPDPARLSLYGITLNQLIDKLTNANRSFLVGAFRENDRSLPVVAGQTLQGVPDIGLLLLTSRDGRPVYVKDVADVVVGAAEPEHHGWTMTRDAKGALEKRPAVSIAIAKRRGANAVVMAAEILSRLETAKGRIVPDDLEISVARNYGETATEKANELLFHLALATLSIVALIVLMVGWREGVVVFVIIPTTILLTMFASWMMGYTINRVSLFALIFSIGILVDDAIVVVENIVRHWQMRGDRGLTETAIEAVAEVGNPTIVATLTIVVALLPMLFVSGLMGPYMSPIPANASLAMVFSFFVAMTITPWLLLKIARGRFEGEGAHASAEHDIGAMGRFYSGVASKLLAGREGSKRFLLIVGLATLASCMLFATKSVRVKLLPFDNKSEIAVVADLPRGASLEETDRLLSDAAERLKDLPELVSIQAYAGTAGAVQFQRPRAALLFAQRVGNGRSVDQSSAQGRAQTRQPRDRARHPQATGWLAKAGAYGDQGCRGAAGAARALDIARRDLWAGRRRSPRDRDQGETSFFLGRFRRRHRRQFWRAGRAFAFFDRSAGARISRRRGTGGLRYDRRAGRRREDRLFAARRRRQADRHHRGVAALRHGAGRAHPFDAIARGRHGAARRECRAWQRRQSLARTQLFSDLSS